MLTATVGKSLITKGYCKRLRTHSRQSERPKIMDVWRCKVLLRYGIRNNVGLYRCRLCGGDVFLPLARPNSPAETIRVRAAALRIRSSGPGNLALLSTSRGS